MGGGVSSGGQATGGQPGSEAGGAAGGTFFGESRCAQAGLLLCDGFEGESIDTTLWTVGKNGTNSVELSREHAARGGRSLHVRTQNGFAYVKNQSVFPVPQNHYFGRMFVRVQRYSTVDWAHWTVAEAAGIGDGSLIRVGGQYRTDLQKNRYGVGSDGGPTGDWTRHDNDPNGTPEEPKVGAWVCLEWEHKGSTNETRMFVDGVLHPSLSTTVTDHGGTSGTSYVLPDFTSIWFGFWQYQSDPAPFDVWIDEVALDLERIGCDN